MQSYDGSEGEIEIDDRSARLVYSTLKALRAPPAFSRDDHQQFLFAVAPYVTRSRGQLFQDLWALWESGMKRGGYFVEFGAGNGIDLSNTYMLEKEFGWTGVVAEPNPAFARSIRRYRGCYVSTKCVFTHSGQTIEFLPAKTGELSRIASVVPQDGHEAKRALGEPEIIQVPTITLHDLLVEAGAPKSIDLLSVDTEGSELEILHVFPFDAWDIRTITVEHNGVEGQRKRIFDLLTSKGFVRKWRGLSRIDDWYVRRP